MVVVGQSVTLLVPELVEGSNSDTESHGEEEAKVLQRVPYVHQILILIQVAQRVNFLNQMVN